MRVHDLPHLLRQPRGVPDPDAGRGLQAARAADHDQPGCPAAEFAQPLDQRAGRRADQHQVPLAVATAHRAHQDVLSGRDPGHVRRVEHVAGHDGRPARPDRAGVTGDVEPGRVPDDGRHPVAARGGLREDGAADGAVGAEHGDAGHGVPACSPGPDLFLAGRVGIRGQQ